MNRRIFIFSLLSLSLSACSTVDNAKHAIGDFKYGKMTEHKKLVVPKGIEEPKTANDYVIPKNINHNGPVGQKIDIRAPSLVLPIASGTRVELNSNKAKIWFDKVLENKNLENFIVSGLKNKLEKDGVEIKTIDAKKHLFESGWYRKTQETGFWLWTEQTLVKSMRFQYQLETKPHGRSVALTVNLIDFEAKDGSKSMDLIDKQRAEVAMLNAVIGHVDYMYRKNQRENRLMRATQKIVSIGQSPSGEPAYIVELEKDYLWSNLPSFFEKYGFTIDDLNESKNIYYVTFKQPNNSLWDTLWGDGAPVIELANAKYQFKLKEVEGKTALVITDEMGKPLSNDILNKVFSVMEPGLSFRNFN